MKRTCETDLTCELCGNPAVYCDSIPDARVPGYSRSECGYRLQSLCWLCGVIRKEEVANLAGQPDTPVREAGDRTTRP